MMNSRREFLAASAGTALGLAGCATPRGAAPSLRERLPDVDAAPMPALAESGVVHDGASLGHFGIDPTRSYPDVRSFSHKFGLLIPATNTSAEHELWSIVLDNPDTLAGVGLHTTGVVTPRPVLHDAADLHEYGRQFVSGLDAALAHAQLAAPHSLIMGMSLEHVLHGLAPIRTLMREVEARSAAPWASWHDAALAALTKFGARRIGLLTPFDRLGNANAQRMFEDLGFEVVSSVGFACSNAMHIAHIPDTAKERAIRELLATPRNRLDAIVQCGTNMSMLAVTQRLEPELGIPILGINAVTFWHALRDQGFAGPQRGAGRLLATF